MRPYYDDGGITIYHGDCREVVPILGLSFAVVSDPPYGMAWDTDSTRFSGAKRREGAGVAHKPISGDAKPFDPSPWLQYERTIMWGTNHFAQRLPVGSTLVWIKKPAHLYGTFLSDAEIGWDSHGHGVYVHYRSFPPPTRIREVGQEKSHPTVKPISLMEWCIRRTPDGMPVLDPFMGSGTTLVAAKNLGRKAIGIELEERYCEIAARRLSQGVLDLGGAA